MTTPEYSIFQKNEVAKQERIINMSTKYELHFINNSTNDGDVCVYQKDPDIGVADVMSLAWLTKRLHTNSTVVFDWDIDYSFVWSETGKLKPKVHFNASQVLQADLSDNNKVTFDYDGAYMFTDQTSGAEGELHIKENSTIPMKMASVGIGMSGKGTFVVQAQPNENLSFRPHPKYWITFGNFTEGMVLDITEITNDKEIVFPPNVYSMTAILNQDNSWTVHPTE